MYACRFCRLCSCRFHGPAKGGFAAQQKAGSVLLLPSLFVAGAAATVALPPTRGGGRGPLGEIHTSASTGVLEQKHLAIVEATTAACGCDEEKDLLVELGSGKESGGGDFTKSALNHRFTRPAGLEDKALMLWPNKA